MNTTLPLTLNYDFSPNTVLYDPDFGHKLDRMRAAGVSSIWLGGFFYGRWEASPEDIARAKTRLEEEGLQVGALSIPLGHGGQAFDPSKPAESKTGDGWQPRVDAAGNPWPNTSCPRHAKVLADSRAAGDLLKQLGFSHLVYDDDLRVGAWGPAVPGLLLRRLYEQLPRGVSCLWGYYACGACRPAGCRRRRADRCMGDLPVRFHPAVSGAGNAGGSYPLPHGHAQR